MKKLLLIISILIVSINLIAAERSSKWQKVRDAYIQEHPYCEVCGTSKDLQVHHIKPFQLFPLLELDKDNLITLCTSKYWGFNCHLWAGHGGNFRWYNRWILEDVGILRIYANPHYIKEFGISDFEHYISYMRKRTKEFNIMLKKDNSLPKENNNAADRMPESID